MGVIEQIRQAWQYASSCFSADYSSVECHTYWNWVAYGAFALAGLIIVLVGWSLYQQHSAYWRGLLHMKGQIGRGSLPDLDSAEMEEKFRAALEKRKAELRNSEPDPPQK